MKSQLTAIHTLADIHPNSGGTSRVVVDLTDVMSKTQPINCLLISQSKSLEPKVESSNGIARRLILESDSSLALKLGLPFRAGLRSNVKENKPFVIHNHGLWLPVNHWASHFAKIQDIPLLIQPHGMLEPWALNHKSWKKRISMALYQRRDLESAQAFFATAEMEYESIRTLGLRQPVAIIPNGVYLSKTVLSNIDVFPKSSTERNLLFLSRIHPKKGILNLIHAWAKVNRSGWRLRIAGPDEAGHLYSVMSLARQLGVSDSIEYLGELGDVDKSAAYHAADLFILPTFSENFGVVVAEALAHNLPVITTRGAPWADLKNYGCGWWVDIGVDPLVTALQEAMSLSDHDRRAMGNLGREYVRRYDWDDIARQTVNVYRWVLEKGSKPDCVRID